MSLIGMLLLSFWKLPGGYSIIQPNDEWQYVLVTAALALTAAIVLAATARKSTGEPSTQLAD